MGVLYTDVLVKIHFMKESAQPFEKTRRHYALKPVIEIREQV